MTERDALENALREIEGAKCSAGRFSSRWWAHALNLQRIARDALAATDTTRETCPGYPDCRHDTARWATESDPHGTFGAPGMMGG